MGIELGVPNDSTVEHGGEAWDKVPYVSVWILVLILIWDGKGVQIEEGGGDGRLLEIDGFLVDDNTVVRDFLFFV